MQAGFKHYAAITEDHAVEMTFPNGYSVHCEWSTKGGDALVWVYREDGGMLPIFADGADMTYLSPAQLGGLLTCVARAERDGKIDW